jgi:nickel transport protein
MKQAIAFALAMIWMTALPAAAAAHGTGYRLIEEAPVIAAEFFYSDKEPMRYAAVLVFSPENNEAEYQNGRTDQNGRFVFYPEMPGTWRITVKDGMGHAVQAEIPVNAPETGSGAIKGLADKNTAPGGRSSKWIKIMLGLSIVLNLFLGMYVMKKGKS